jgi:hypothetical protein
LPLKQGSRTGKVAINSWHDPAVAQQLKMLAAEQRTTQQKFIEEGLDAGSRPTLTSPLRQRMIEDMAARKLNPATRRRRIGI